MTDIQYVSDESGQPTAVIVPIELWREIESEEETAYLLKSENMKRRVGEADDHIRSPQRQLWVKQCIMDSEPA